MLPFDELQKLVNEHYYKRRGRKLYSDFKTFGSSDKIAHVNAIEFYSWLIENHKGNEIKIYDFGIGNGMFSKFFLRKFYSLDKRKEFLPFLSYFVCDISEKLVKKAEKELSDFEVQGIVCNALDKLDFMRGASYVRSNEMYDDLPAKIFVRKGIDVFEVLMDEKMQKECVPCRSSGVQNFMKKMPEGYEVPINLGAEKHLGNCLHQLVPGGYIDIFDYGFGSLDEISELPAEIWNNSIVREFNSQLTVDVNFLRMQKLFKHSGISPQKEYAERILREKLFYVELEQLYYLTKSEIRKNKTKMKKYGYSADFLSEAAREKDDYKQFRVRK